MLIQLYGAFLIVMALTLIALVGAVGNGAFDCPTEDSNWCYWDAARMGNGQGTSFIALWERN